ncbi:hypothetical protein B0O80DRAFT_516114 [Mortierella sp. GBAus27b]|nr:hypothetical protein B0O80DRAFT_516114 [Mortierella sp. GBAus27b]
MRTAFTLIAACCLLLPPMDAATMANPNASPTALRINPRKGTIRMKHVYSAYDAIVHSDSQLPMFLNHQNQQRKKNSSSSKGTNSKEAKSTSGDTNANSTIAKSPKRSKSSFSAIKQLLHDVFGARSKAQSTSVPLLRHGLAIGKRSMGSRSANDQPRASSIGSDSIDSDSAPTEGNVSSKEKSTIVINGYEYQEHQDHYHRRLHDDEDFITRFLHRSPSEPIADMDDDGEVDYPCTSSHPPYRHSVSTSVLHQTLLSFALAMTGFLSLLLVVSYKMYARRMNTSPLAFFHYVTFGVFTSPFKDSSEIAHSTVATYAKLSRSSSPSSTRHEPSEKDTAASASSVQAGPIMTEMRRTSASQYHLQQQLQATGAFANHQTTYPPL